jgi:hypothetical protein
MHQSEDWVTVPARLVDRDYARRITKLASSVSSPTCFVLTRSD